MENTSIYKERMLNCYSPAIQRIYEFLGIVDGEYPEFDLFAQKHEEALDDAYLTTMGEDRIYEWETKLGLPHDDELPIRSRRNLIISHIFQKYKLNTATLDFLVDTFTQGHATYKIEDGTLYINFYPHVDSVFKLKSFVNEIMARKPAHIGYMVNQVNDCGKDGENTLYVTCITTQCETHEVVPHLAYTLQTVGNMRVTSPVTHNETFNVIDSNINKSEVVE